MPGLCPSPRRGGWAWTALPGWGHSCWDVVRVGGGAQAWEASSGCEVAREPRSIRVELLACVESGWLCRVSTRSRQCPDALGGPLTALPMPGNVMAFGLDQIWFRPGQHGPPQSFPTDMGLEAPFLAAMLGGGPHSSLRGGVPGPCPCPRTTSQVLAQPPHPQKLSPWPLVSLWLCRDFIHKLWSPGQNKYLGPLLVKL